MAEVYRAAGETEALVIKGLLESYGISCLLKSKAAPSVHMFAVGAEKAKKLITREKNV